MKDEKQTKEKLLAAAKEEFLDKGYMKASLREICQKAGVTTGALYFFFHDKEDLFAALVEKPLQQLITTITSHYSEELTYIDKLVNLPPKMTEDMEVNLMVLNMIYDQYDYFVLLVLRSQGSKFQTCIEDLVDMSAKHYRLVADFTSEALGVPKLADFDIHWFTHVQIDSYVYYLTHKRSREDAIRHSQVLMKFLYAGWFSMFEKPSTDEV